MKRKNLYNLMLVAAMAITFAGCGVEDNSGTMFSESVNVSPEPLLSPAESTIVHYEYKYNLGEFLQEDYLDLAELYGQVGRIRDQRDLLEQGYRLFEDEEIFEALQTITVNLAEEKEIIGQEAQTMLNNLELEEYRNEAINMIVNRQWFDRMMPKLMEGRRNYYLEQNGQVALVIQAGYSEEGVPFSNVWYTGEEGEVLYLTQEGNTLQMLETSLAEGCYEGEFEAWSLDGNTGDMIWEEGTFENGAYVGAYTIGVHEGKGGSDLFSLWSNKEGMSYTEYEGSLEADGKTFVLGELTYTFEEETLILESYPEFVTYAVAEQENASVSDGSSEQLTQATEEMQQASNAPQIRIFDGMIQYHNGEKWVSLGEIEALSKEDPFYSYAAARDSLMEATWNGNAGSAEGNGRFVDKLGILSLREVEEQAAEETIDEAEPTPAPTATPKPTARPSKPASPSKPSNPTVTPSPAPTPTPTPEPEAEPDWSPDIEEDTDSDMEPETEEEPESEETPEPDTGSGEDTDIEWSDDIL